MECDESDQCVLSLISCYICFVALVIGVGISFIVLAPYCDALYFGIEEPKTVVFPDLQNLQLWENRSLLTGTYWLPNQYKYYLKIEKNELGEISLCVIKRHFTRVSACFEMGKWSVLCQPDMRPDCLPSSTFSHFIGASVLFTPKSEVSYTVLNLESSAKLTKVIDENATLSAVWHDVLHCQVIVNVTIAIIIFGIMSCLAPLGCVLYCIYDCSQCCKRKR